MDNIKSVEVITTLHKIAMQQDMIVRQLIEINEMLKVLPDILEKQKIIAVQSERQVRDKGSCD